MIHKSEETYQYWIITDEVHAWNYCKYIDGLVQDSISSALAVDIYCSFALYL